MGLLIILLTFVLIVDCLFLMLLILVQLPRKEAGIGQAFGGGATDALFGAGSGTALTKLTKYSAAFFLGIAVVLSVVIAQDAERRAGGLSEELRKRSGSSMVLPPAVTNTLPQITPSTRTNQVPTLSTNAPSANPSPPGASPNP